jgi:D-3-phosphoglycerate dehydrogenase
MKPIVLVPEEIASQGVKLLEADCDVVAPWMTASPVEPAMLEVADGVIVRLFKIGQAELDSAVRLKVIAKHGVGLDNIAVDLALARGVAVLNTPTANTNAVAEHTVALMLAMARQIVPAALATRQGQFGDRARFQGVEVCGSTLGIVGFGRTGSRVAEIAKGLGMHVLAYDPLVSTKSFVPYVRRILELDDLLGEADFLSFHVPLTPETHHLLNSESLARLKTSCRIVNTSRGAVIDEQALVRALESGAVAGAALDVFEVEPPSADHPLCRAPNTLLTPHISSSTKESLEKMAVDAARGVLDVLAGRKPDYPVNPGAPA